MLFRRHVALEVQKLIQGANFSQTQRQVFK